MPRFFVPYKSGVHRAACFALYRALLRQKNRLLLTQSQRVSLEIRLRNGFQRHATKQSPSVILSLLRRGHEILRVLHKGVRKPEETSSHVSRFIPDLLMETPPPALVLSKQEKKARSVARRRLRWSPHVQPNPNATPVLSRPFPKVSGRRQVPRLVVANGFPFLRFKKPQSKYLGRLIRDSSTTRQRRFDRVWEFKSQLEIAEEEDEWDLILKQKCQVKLDETWVSWGKEVESALNSTYEALNEKRRKQAKMAEKLLEIIRKEQLLAQEEKMKRRDEKHKARKARRLAKKEAEAQANQEGTDPAKPTDNKAR